MKHSTVLYEFPIEIHAEGDDFRVDILGESYGSTRREALKNSLFALNELLKAIADHVEMVNNDIIKDITESN